MDAVSHHLRQLRNDFFQVRLETQQCEAELHAFETRAAALKAEEHEKLHMLAAQDNFIVQKSSELYLLDQQLEQKRKELAIASDAIASLKVVHSEMTRYTVELATVYDVNSDMVKYTDELQSDLRAAQDAFLDRNTELDAEYQAKSTELNAEARARQDKIEYWLSQQSHRLADLNVSVASATFEYNKLQQDIPRLRQQVEEACPAKVDDDAYATENEEPAIPPQGVEVQIGDAMLKYEEGRWWKQSKAGKWWPREPNRGGKKSKQRRESAASSSTTKILPTPSTITKPSRPWDRT